MSSSDIWDKDSVENVAAYSYLTSSPGSNGYTDEGQASSDFSGRSYSVDLSEEHSTEDKISKINDLAASNPEQYVKEILALEGKIATLEGRIKLKSDLLPETWTVSKVIEFIFLAVITAFIYPAITIYRGSRAEKEIEDYQSILEGINLQQAVAILKSAACKNGNSEIMLACANRMEARAIILDKKKQSKEWSNWFINQYSPDFGYGEIINSQLTEQQMEEKIKEEALNSNYLYNGNRLIDHAWRQQDEYQALKCNTFKAFMESNQVSLEDKEKIKTKVLNSIPAVLKGMKLDLGETYYSEVIKIMSSDVGALMREKVAQQLNQNPIEEHRYSVSLTKENVNISIAHDKSPTLEWKGKMIITERMQENVTAGTLDLTVTVDIPDGTVGYTIGKSSVK